MMSRTIFMLAATLIVASACTIYAASDDFTVRTLIGADTMPPTTPTGLIAVPVATSQINLTWSSSTDDGILSGYQVFRDDVQIATTTIPSYSDVGLLPDTLYSYYVTAFDSFNNVSASSSIVSTTTLALAPPEGPGGEPQAGRRGGRMHLELTRLEIFPEQHVVTLRYETNIIMRTVIKWGRTTSYELGSLAEQSFGTVHETKIAGLLPGTAYRFTIIGENGVGVTDVLTEGTFATLPIVDTFAPGNVRNLSASRRDSDVLLSWLLPSDQDLSKVRIVRSDRFYPGDPQDGWVVYEGVGTQAIDRGVAIPGTVQYYTAFSYDTLGNISSGAVVSIRFTDAGTAPVSPPPVVEDRLNLAFSDFTFLQDSLTLQPEGLIVTIDGGKRLTIELPYERVPERLKTILVTIADQSDPNLESSFLLRINREQTAYTATLAPLGVGGDFPVRVSVFDYDTAQIGYADGILRSVITFFPREPVSRAPLSFSLWEFLITPTTGFLVLFVLLLIMLAFGVRRIASSDW